MSHDNLQDDLLGLENEDYGTTKQSLLWKNTREWAWATLIGFGVFAVMAALMAFGR